MIAPPSLCGDPRLVEENDSEKQKRLEKQNQEYDEDSILPPVLPTRRFNFLPTWVINHNKEEEKSNDKKNDSSAHGLELIMRAYIQLPPTDALALLQGEDHTGMMIWQGSARLCQHLFDNFLPILRPDEAMLSHYIESSFPQQKKSKVEGGDESASQSETEKLMMSSFVKEALDQRSMANFQNVDTLVEIGCGSGILGLVAGYAMKAKSIIMTDGNKDCTDLAESNFNLNYEKNFKKTLTIGKGRELKWKNLSGEETSKLLFSHREKLEFSAESSIVIVGGDVVYDFDSVIPLVETINSLSVNFLDVKNSLSSNREEDTTVQTSRGRAHFFLCFYPRQWYVADNRILLENVKDKLATKGWKLVLEAGSGDHDGTLLHFILDH